MMRNGVIQSILAGGLVALAACAPATDRVPFDIDGRILIVTGDTGAGGGMVSGVDGASLSQADGAAADRAFHEYCRTQGRNGTKGSYAMMGSAGVWQYNGCTR